LGSTGSAAFTPQRTSAFTPNKKASLEQCGVNVALQVFFLFGVNADGRCGVNVALQVFFWYCLEMYADA
jgi:hypothetical protein